MKGIIPFNCKQSSSSSHWTPFNNVLHKQVEALEPCSVLDQTTTSPSPSSSHSAGVAALSDNNHHHNQRKPNSINGGDKDEQWASELHPIPPPPTGLLTADSLDDWEAVLSCTAAAASSPATQQQTFLNWITGDVQDTIDDDEVDPGFQHPFATPPSSLTTPTAPSVPNCLPILNNNNNNNGPSFFINHHQLSNSTFSLPSPSPEAHNPKRHCSIPQAHQHQPIVDQLFKAADFIERGNLFGAREILARLNQILANPPVGFKPVIRSAFIFKEAISVLLSGSPSSIPLNPLDVVLKLSSYKAFSEVSPLTHFTNFTCAQTLLEEVGGFNRIHIVDFDIGGGGGGHWSSFIQELASRRSGAPPSLKITAFVSTSSFHPLELHLTRENLIHFASELKIPFEFSFFAIESFDPNELLAVSAPNEAFAVNLPVGFDYPQTFPMILRLVKQLNPKIVVSVDQGYDQNFIHLFQPLVVLLDSIDASGTSADIVNKIERFLIQPRIENAVLGRYRTAAKIAPLREIFASVGFAQGQFSNFTEAQAECLLKRVQVRGFHVEKRQGSIFLYWQRGELGSVSAWKC